MATSTRTRTVPATNGTTAAPAAVDPSALAKQIRQVMQQQYNIKLKSRSQRVRTVIGYATREMLGSDYDPETIAQALALLFDRISLEPEQAIADLLEYNRESLPRRYQHNGQHDHDNGAEDVLDSLDDLNQPDDDLVGLDDEEL